MQSRMRRDLANDAEHFNRTISRRTQPAFDPIRFDSHNSNKKSKVFCEGFYFWVNKNGVNQKLEVTAPLSTGIRLMNC